MQYTVLIHKAEEGGYWVEVPALGACYSHGKTEDEALANVKDAIKTHIEGLKAEGRDIPTEEDVVGTIKVAV
jgi:predicted RNase H-like HicB family nuclease